MIWASAVMGWRCAHVKFYGGVCMKSKTFLSVISIILTVSLLFGTAVGVSAADNAVTYRSGEYFLTKISHPAKYSGETDGIVDYIADGVVSASDNGQGDRAQNYAWASVPYGDCVYVSTNYNSLGLTLGFMDSVLGHDFETEQMNATLDVMFNGHFFTGEPDGANTGGLLTKINTKTNEVTVLMGKSVDGNSVQLRNACIFKDKLYFCGSVNGLPKIVEVDPETDKCTIIYEGINPKDYYAAYLQGICTGIRGLCAFGDYLIVSMVTLEGPQILISANPSEGQDAFTLIADQEALYDYPAYHFPDSIYGGSIWEMAEYNNSLYVSICTGTPDNMPNENTMQSFAVVRGDMGDSFDEWSWTPVIGDKEDGARYTFGVDPERTRAGAGVFHIYDGYLYIGEYNDEEIPLERILFDADFDFMNANLEQSVSLYRMDKDENIELVMGNATKMFPNGSLSGLKSGFGRNENQYIWRMGDYNGKLYVGTFDTSSLLEPIGQFANGDLLTMNPSEWVSLIQYVKKLIEVSDTGDEDSSTDSQNVKALFKKYSVKTIASMAAKSVNGKCTGNEAELESLMKTVKGLLKCAGYMKDATRGFDLYVSEDGINFTAITTDGFGDPYNHGLRTFSALEDGLMIGTANPFYACQIWMLTDGNEVEKEDNSLCAILERVFGDVIDYFVTFFKEFHLIFDLIF